MAVGNAALSSNTTGVHNLAVGDSTLVSAETAQRNTAVGQSALNLATAGDNTGIGALALLVATTGTGNTAVGSNALVGLAGGSGNLALGISAGAALTSGSNNVYIGVDPGVSSESNATYIRNISGSTSSGGAGVFVNAAGKLGTVTSSIRFKEQVSPIADAATRLQSLNPVSFYYKPEFDDGSRLKQVRPDRRGGGRSDAGAGDPRRKRRHSVGALPPAALPSSR